MKFGGGTWNSGMWNGGGLAVVPAAPVVGAVTVPGNFQALDTRPIFLQLSTMPAFQRIDTTPMLVVIDTTPILKEV